MWNSLPDDIKDVKTPQSFKKKTKEYTLVKCTLCSLIEIGNLYHYLLVCPEFKIARLEHINKYYYTQPNKKKLTELLNEKNCCEILHLNRFKEKIYRRVISFD